jgi:hypothetical protein
VQQFFRKQAAVQLFQALDLGHFALRGAAPLEFLSI